MFHRHNPGHELDTAATIAAVKTYLECAIPGRVEAVARSLGVTPVMRCPCCCGTCCCENSRPYFGPRQVRCVCQIQRGRRYIQRCRDGYTQSIMVTNSTPFQDKDNIGWWVSTDKGDVSLADCGVIRYRDRGGWNQTNWLEFADGCCC